jgi:hypothetical protein
MAQLRLVRRRHMPTPLILVGNAIRADLALNELPRTIAAEDSDIVVFEWRSIPGVIAGAAFDWVAVLSVAADLLAVAGALWAAYEKLIKKRRQKKFENPPAFLIEVSNQQNTTVRFLIQEGTSREIFVEEFQRTVSALRASEASKSEETIIEEYERSESHKRVRVREERRPQDNS